MTAILVIDDCEPIELECASCHGDGRRGDAYCPGCGGTGCDFVSRQAMYTLAHNLGIAGALCRAFEIGRDLQHALTNADMLSSGREREYERRHIMRDYFHPGCGRGAPVR